MDPLTDITVAGFAVKLAIVIGLSLLARYVFAKDSEEPIDDTPTTLVSQGAKLPVVFGVRRVGAIMVLADGRFTRKEKVKSNGKGAGQPEQEVTIYYEHGIHCLAVGPGRTLRRILVQGEPIFTGPITQETAPSGTRIDLGDEGIFEIWWGRTDDPEDSWANQRLETNSRFDYIFRVNWIEKRLGQVAQWPIIDYEIEVEPNTPISSLDPEKAWFEGALQPSEQGQIAISGIDFTENIFYFTDNNVNFAAISSALKLDIVPTVDGIGKIPPSTWTIQSIFKGVKAKDTNLKTSLLCLNPDPFGISFNFFNPEFPLIAVRVVEPLPGNGTVQSYFACFQLYGGIGVYGTQGNFPGQATMVVEGNDNGANAAHVLATLLFSPPPQGVGLDPKFWDLQSFQTVSDLVEAEGIRTSIIAEQGQTVQSIVGELLLDLGIFARLNSTSGLLELAPLRPGQKPTIEIPAEAVQGNLPEIEHVVQPLRTNKVLYKFADRAQAYKNGSILISDDGSAALNDFEGLNEIRLPTVVDFNSAARIALRREQEALGSQDTISLRVGYAGRQIRPGREVRVPGFPFKLLVLKVTLDPDGIGAQLVLAPTGYMAPATPLQLEDQSSPTTGTAETPKIAQARFWQPPAALKVTGAPVELRALWVRENSSASQLILNLSLDGTSYQSAGTEPFPIFGGQISEDIPDSPAEIAQVNTSFLSPDVGTVPDLTGNQPAIDNGQLLCLIDEELFFIGGFSPGLADGVGSIVTMQRAKYGTSTAEHPAGSRFWIFQPNILTPQVNSAFFQSGVNFFAKLQAVGAAPPTPLTEILPISFQPS